MTLHKKITASSQHTQQLHHSTHGWYSLLGHSWTTTEVQCCHLAKKEAVTRVCHQLQTGAHPPSSGLLPMEQSTILVNGSKLTSDISESIRYECSRIKAKQSLCTRTHMNWTWTSDQFDEVSCETLDTVLLGKSPGYRIWLAKQHNSTHISAQHEYKWNDGSLQKMTIAQAAWPDLNGLTTSADAQMMNAPNSSVITLMSLRNESVNMVTLIMNCYTGFLNTSYVKASRYPFRTWGLLSHAVWWR